MSRARAPGTRPPPPPLLLLLPLLPLLLCPTVRGDCGLPPDIPNATPSLEGKTSFPEKSSVVYTCNKGYQEIPNKLNTATCLNGSWSNLETFCNQSCDAPTMVPFASLKKIYITVNYFPIGTVVEYECRPGYLRVPSLSGKSTCLANLEWSKIDEICKKKSCPNPGDLSNGHINIPKGLLFGSKIQFSCNTGYKLVGSTFSFCVVWGDSVNWDSDIPTCVEIFCPDPPKISNGEIHGESDSYVYRQVVTYTCAKGFLLVGEHSIYCNVNQDYGEWSGPPPSCMEKSTIPTTPQKPTTVHIAGTTVLSTSKRPTTGTRVSPMSPTTVHVPPTAAPPTPQKSTKANIPSTAVPPTPQRPNTADDPSVDISPVPLKPNTTGDPATEIPRTPQKTNTTNVPASEIPPTPQKTNTADDPATEIPPTPQKTNTANVPATEDPPTPQKTNTTNVQASEIPPTPQKSITAKSSTTKTATAQISPLSNTVSAKNPPITQSSTTVNSPAVQTTQTTQRFATAKPSFTQSLPATQRHPISHLSVTKGVQIVTQRFTSARLTATPYVPATKTTVQRPTRTSKVNEKSTSGGDHLIYGHTCLITLTVLHAMLLLIG